MQCVRRARTRARVIQPTQKPSRPNLETDRSDTAQWHAVTVGATVGARGRRKLRGWTPAGMDSESDPGQSWARIPCHSPIPSRSRADSESLLGFRRCNRSDAAN